MENKISKVQKPLFKLLLAVLIVGVIVSGAVALVPQIAQAQDETPPAPNNGLQPPDAGIPPADAGGLMPGGLPGFGRMGKPGFGDNVQYETYLAEALGISVEDLQAARQKADQAMLDQSVSDGKITAEQAELITARQALRAYLDREVLMANALGITVDELRASREEGKTINTLLDELGIEPEAFQQAMQTAYSEAVQQAVEDGVITQEQADQILSTDPGLGGFGGPMEGHNRRGGPLNGKGLFNQNTQPTQDAGQ